MHTLFTALKQDTLDKHTTLEETPPFSLFHNLSEFSTSTYNDVLSVMSVFHSTTSSHVSKAQNETPSLNRLAEMLNTDEVSAALHRDTNALQFNFAESFDTETNVENQAQTSQSLDIQTVNALENQLSFRGQNSAAIAAIYVWLGSSMGANMISRRLEKLNNDVPTAYYSAMAGCAKAWVPFKQTVEHILAELKLDDDKGIRDIVEDANSWFSFLISLGKAQTGK
ncbi:biliverdin-producing heme oxygenase [Alteromonas sp. BMJM2]|uniref:biliverdin-producing heme oxygenase n=1 Tax=Alteromonas sp. BMJM2 TaxID=2954241 RepID=UPI0022B4F7A4|nr:biliverdin-producing heme oxygenase [Alteromonas sp. BMJM2]